MSKNKFDPKEILNSKRIFKSATPKGDMSWYIKWVGSSFILVAMSLRGIEGFTLIDLILSIVGVSAWLWVGLIWKDRALIILNAVGLVLLLKNLLIEYIV
tara:strand:- start:338 stop:637 length:300 start_codon:yes stop_codon:yes gene_type:complete